MFTHSPPTIVSRFAPLYGRREHLHCGRPILCHIHRRTLLMKPQIHRAVRWQSDSLKTQPTVHRRVYLLLKPIKDQACRLHDCIKPRFVCLQFRLRLGQENRSYATREVPTGSAYTGCPRRNGQNFGRVFLMLNYTDITQNTYIQS